MSSLENHAGPVCMVVFSSDLAEVACRALSYYVCGPHQRPGDRAAVAGLIELLAGLQCMPADPGPAPAPAPARSTVAGWHVERRQFDTWVPVPDTQRADPSECFDLCEHLSVEFPATRYRVTESTRARA